MRCGHYEGYVMGIGNNQFCGICKIESQRVEIEQLQADAGRYRWLIEHAANKVLDPRNEMRIEVAVSYYGGGYQLVGQAMSDWIDRRLPTMGSRSSTRGSDFIIYQYATLMVRQARRIRDKWSEGDENVKRDLWQCLHETGQRLAEVLGLDDQPADEIYPETTKDSDTLPCCGSDSGVHLVGCQSEDAHRIHRAESDKNTEYTRAPDARGPAQTIEEAESSRHQGSGVACADRDHRAPDPGRLLPEKD